MSKHFEIAKNQLQEIENFYLALGYTQSQAKALSRSAFDSAVSGVEGVQYCDGLNFYSYSFGSSPTIRTGVVGTVNCPQ